MNQHSSINAKDALVCPEASAAVILRAQEFTKNWRMYTQYETLELPVGLYMDQPVFCHSEFHPSPFRERNFCRFTAGKDRDGYCKLCRSVSSTSSTEEISEMTSNGKLTTVTVKRCWSSTSQKIFIRDAGVKFMKVTNPLWFGFMIPYFDSDGNGDISAFMNYFPRGLRRLWLPDSTPEHIINAVNKYYDEGVVKVYAITEDLCHSRTVQVKSPAGEMKSVTSVVTGHLSAHLVSPDADMGKMGTWIDVKSRVSDGTNVIPIGNLVTKPIGPIQICCA